MFSRGNYGVKGKCYVLSGYEQNYKMCFVYLGSRLEQRSYGWSILSMKTVERKYSTKIKKEATFGWCNYKRNLKKKKELMCLEAHTQQKKLPSNIFWRFEIGKKYDLYSEG